MYRCALVHTLGISPCGWVSCMCTLMSMFPCSVHVKSVSRKGRVPSLSRSMVNWMEGCMLLERQRETVWRPALKNTKQQQNERKPRSLP